MGRRREQRIEISLPVRVCGLDGNGNPFIQSARTMDVTRNGARLGELFCLARAGEVIRIQHGMKKANFRVAWIGHPGSAISGQVGVHSMEPDKYIWGIPLPKASPVDAYVAKHPELPPSREMRAAVSASAAGSTAAAAAQTAKITRIEERSGEMRAHRRYSCNGSVEIGVEGSDTPLWCALSDLSISGCYAETTAPLPLDTHVDARLKIFGTEVQTQGTVRTCHAGVGMGISFAQMSEEDQRRIYCILEIIAEKAANGAPALVASPNTLSLAGKPEAAPQHGRSFLVFHNRSRQDNAKGKKKTPVDPQLRERLRQLNRELEDLPKSLQPGQIDSRIQQEASNILSLARQAIVAIEQWIELESKGRDPFQVLHELNGERVQGAAGMNRRLAMDIDAAEIDFDTAGLKELHESTDDLHERLQKLFKKA
jgi:hypothetical protein